MTKKTVELEHLGSLITVKDSDRCLGYLLTHEDKVWDADLGRVPVTVEQAKTHNRLFDEALIEGFDEWCEVGQGALFYLSGGKLATWLGTVVSEKLKVTAKTVTMERKGRTFVGRRRGGEPAVFMQRKT